MELTRYQLKYCPDKCKNLPEIFISYGTSGFRYRADLMPTLVYRIGILSSFRSKMLRGTVGVMITASHNPVEDNGVKMIDSNGAMLAQDWEVYAEEICNLENQKLGDYIEQLVTRLQIDILHPANVIIGKDTRESGGLLVDLLTQGIMVPPACSYYYYGTVTTPMLHFLVSKSNCSKVFAREEEYFEALVSGYKLFTESMQPVEDDVVHVDGANGVGAIKLQQLKKEISNFHGVDIQNEGSGILNYMCGADFVMLNQTEPKDFRCECGSRCVSFDGDADRIIYFTKESPTDPTVTLLHGDYISALYCLFIKTCIDAANLGGKVELAYVHTAYTNQKAIAFISSMGVTTCCTKTGVKHLHEQALLYDFGVYFEANGHGTMLLKDSARTMLNQLSGDTSHGFHAKKLLHFSEIVNKTNGDALANFVAVECILRYMQFGVKEWKALFQPSPSLQVKAMCANRHLIRTSANDSKITEPIEMQTKIDEILSHYDGARCFARPSGTEDYVRVYAEANSLRECQEICDQVQNFISSYVL